jgi:hypothetical protein
MEGHQNMEALDFYIIAEYERSERRLLLKNEEDLN